MKKFNYNLYYYSNHYIEYQEEIRESFQEFWSKIEANSQSFSDIYLLFHNPTFSKDHYEKNGKIVHLIHPGLSDIFSVDDIFYISEISSIINDYLNKSFNKDQNDFFAIQLLYCCYLKILETKGFIKFLAISSIYLLQNKKFNWNYVQPNSLESTYNAIFKNSSKSPKWRIVLEQCIFVKMRNYYGHSDFTRFLDIFVTNDQKIQFKGKDLKSRENILNFFAYFFILIEEINRKKLSVDKHFFENYSITNPLEISFILPISKKENTMKIYPSISGDSIDGMLKFVKDE